MKNGVLTVRMTEDLTETNPIGVRSLIIENASEIDWNAADLTRFPRLESVKMSMKTPMEFEGVNLGTAEEWIACVPTYMAARFLRSFPAAPNLKRLELRGRVNRRRRVPERSIPLEKYPLLEEVCFSWARGFDYSNLSACRKLRKLFIRDCGLERAEWLSELPYLDCLCLQGSLRSFRDILWQTELQELDLSENLITDFSGLSQLHKLYLLNVRGNPGAEKETRHPELSRFFGELITTPEEEAVHRTKKLIREIKKKAGALPVREGRSAAQELFREKFFAIRPDNRDFHACYRRGLRQEYVRFGRRFLPGVEETRQMKISCLLEELAGLAPYDIGAVWVLDGEDAHLLKAETGEDGSRRKDYFTVYSDTITVPDGPEPAERILDESLTAGRRTYPHMALLTGGFHADAGGDPVISEGMFRIAEALGFDRLVIFREGLKEQIIEKRDPEKPLSPIRVQTVGSMERLLAVFLERK